MTLHTETDPTAASRARSIATGWLSVDHLDIDRLRELVAEPVLVEQVPNADRLADGVPVYSSSALRERAADPVLAASIAAELAWVWLYGPGIAVFEGAFDDLDVIDRVSATFDDIIAEQHAAGRATGDHYAPPGSNDRIWNAQEKLALRDPSLFASYFDNEIVALAALAWLGPRYQVTTQPNVVNPGGRAQSPHCDYHLGFLTNAEAESFPAHVHQLSAVLTLQGAVAHCDMPVESGPTMYLPHSQKYLPAYIAWRDPAHRALFDERRVQLPLAKGDAVFFNPKLFHAAGDNRTSDVRRMANLLQISSAFGRALERVDRHAMCVALYPTLLDLAERGAAPGSIARIVAAAAEGYAFPTDLDRDPPIGGLAPPAQAALVLQAIGERWPAERVIAELEAHRARRSQGSAPT